MGMSSYASSGPTETIVLRLKVENADNAELKIRKLEKGMSRLQNYTVDAGNGMRKNVKIQDKATKSGKELDRVLTTTWLRKGPQFRMQMLSVMFFGMQLQRTFSGILTPALQLVGVFELWGLAMELLFLPFALDVMNWMIWLIDEIDNLPDWAKWWLGVAAAVAIVAAAIMVAIGQLDLFMGALGSSVVVSSLSKLAGAFGLGAAGKSMLAPVALGGGAAEAVGAGVVTAGLGSAAAAAGLAAIGVVIADAFLDHVKTYLGKEGSDNLFVMTPDIPKFEVFGYDIGRAIQNGIDNALAYANVGDVLNVGIHGLMYGGQKQFGGVIPREGLYHLHQGETVVSNGQGGGGVVFSPTINATGFSESQTRQIANRLYDLMRQDLITQTGRF